MTPEALRAVHSVSSEVRLADSTLSRNSHDALTVCSDAQPPPDVGTEVSTPIPDSAYTLPIPMCEPPHVGAPYAQGTSSSTMTNSVLSPLSDGLHLTV